MQLFLFCRLSLIFGLIVGEAASSLPTRWKIGQYSKCSSSCGRGVQSRSISCIEIFGDTDAPASLCPSPMPSSTRSCSIVACTPEWVPGPWRECSKTCGRGFQHRELRCQQRLADGLTTVVADDYCPRLRISVRRTCAMVDCPPRYSVKKWIECSSSCGGGFQFRPVHCTRIRGGTHTADVVSRSFCSHLVSPVTKRRCNQNKCTVNHLKGPSGHLENPDDTERDGRYYFRRRRTHRTRSFAGKSLRLNDHLRRRYRLQSRKHFARDSSLSQRPSRRRSVAIDKGRVYLCGSNSRGYRNYSRGTGKIEHPCIERNAFDSSKRETQRARNLEKLSFRQIKYTMPYIVTQSQDSPVQIAGDIVTYVGGRLTVSDTQTITILCEVSGFPPPTTGWFKGGIRLIEDDRHVLLPDHSLRLIRPHREDGGNYTCVARNTIGKTSASTVLSVATRPKIISAGERSDHFDSQTVDARIGSVIRASPGSLIRISCPVEGFPPPRIRWEKDVAGLGENVRILPDNSLEIDIASSVDQGLYNCEATNPIGTDYRSSTLLLFETPRLQEFLTSLDIPSGISRGLPRLLTVSERRTVYKVDNRASALLGCPIAGHGLNKIPISWTFRNRPIHLFSQELRFQILVDGSVLFLETIEEDSTGIYSCHAINEAGNVTGSLEIRLAYYEWVPDKMTPCSHTCGGSGVQYLPVNCVREGTETVPDLHCDKLEKPETLKNPCNRENCPARFHVGPWGLCSKSCGTGEKWRKVSCLVLKSDNDLKVVSSSLCMQRRSSFNGIDNESTRKPSSVESCYLNACPRWSNGPWSQCGDKCYALGMSIRARRLYCMNTNGTTVSRMKCSHTERPKWRELCFTWRCEAIWAVSSWSFCSRSCGDDGIQTRILNCVFRGNKWQQAGNLCDISRRPHVSTPCGRIPCHVPE